MPRKPDPAFATALVKLMASQGLSQAELARRLDVSPTQISRWTRGLEVPSISRIESIAVFFGVDRESLERLAGWRASDVAGAQDTPQDIERQRWRSWFEELLDKKVPKSMWTAYTAACEALAESFSSAQSAAESALSTDEPKRTSKPRKGSSGSKNGGGRDLTLDYPAQLTHSQIAKLLAVGTL